MIIFKQDFGKRQNRQDYGGSVIVQVDKLA